MARARSLAEFQKSFPDEESCAAFLFKQRWPDGGAMTAAHRTLPFGSRVTVVNHGNGRSAVVRINDRGPFVHGRVIDLSPAAARVLGIDGLASVSLTTQPKAHRPGWLENPRPL